MITRMTGILWFLFPNTQDTTIPILL